MVRVSNTLIGCLNFLVLLLSIPIFAAGIYMATRHGSECEKVMQGRTIAIGAFLIVVSLAGFIGACCRVTWLMWLYLVLMFLVILLNVCFIVFDFAVTADGGGGEAMAGRGFKEYRLEDYSHWVRDAVNDTSSWRKTRSCLVVSMTCKRLQQSNESYSQFFKSQLDPIQSGCCKPPMNCGFQYEKPTVWTEPPSGLAAHDNPDCRAWSNNNATLCYDCSSCKAGVAANLKENWKTSAIVNTVSVAILIVVYSVGCCALRNNREDNALPKLKGWA